MNQLVPDVLGLPEHGGESFLSKKVKGTVTDTEQDLLFLAKCNESFMISFFSIHYVGYFNFFLNLQLSLSFDAGHNF